MRRRFKLKAFIILVAVFALGILLPLILHASTVDNARTVKVAYTQKGFIENLAPTAQKMSKNYGVLASILLSQAAYESNYGSSLLSVKYHNIYSLPARPGQEHIYLKDNVYSKGKWQYQKVDFAVFRDWSSSMSSYLEELRQGRRMLQDSHQHCPQGKQCRTGGSYIRQVYPLDRLRESAYRTGRTERPEEEVR